MSKAKLQARVPRNTERAIKEYQEANDIEAESEAARQLIEAGVDAQAGHTPGERLAETGTAISGVGGSNKFLSDIGLEATEANQNDEMRLKYVEL